MTALWLLTAVPSYPVIALTGYATGSRLPLVPVAAVIGGCCGASEGWPLMPVLAAVLGTVLAQALYWLCSNKEKHADEN